MSRPSGPPQGSRPLRVATNSFKITGLPKKEYYQYDGELHSHVVTTRHCSIRSLLRVRVTHVVCECYELRDGVTRTTVHSWVLPIFPAFGDDKVSRDPRRRIEVFERLQNHTQPGMFKPKAIYDSDAIAYSSIVLSFGNAATVSQSEGP